MTQQAMRQRDANMAAEWGACAVVRLAAGLAALRDDPYSSDAYYLDWARKDAIFAAHHALLALGLHDDHRCTICDDIG